MIKFKEAKGFSSVKDKIVCRQLTTLGVENIVVYPTKIEFEWCDHILKYENRTFSGVQNRVASCANISQVDKDVLNFLVGKLTDEQFERVGILIDMFEDDLKHFKSKKEDLEWLDLQETPFYRVNNEAIESLEYKLKKLKKTLQTGYFDGFKSMFIESFILMGGGVKHVG